MSYGPRVWDVGQRYREQDSRRRVPMRTLLGIPGDEEAMPMPSLPMEEKPSTQRLAYTGNRYLDQMATGQARDRQFSTLEPGPEPTWSQQLQQLIQGESRAGSFRERLGGVAGTGLSMSPVQGVQDVYRAATGHREAAPLSMAAMGILPGGKLVAKGAQKAARAATEEGTDVLFRGVSPHEFTPEMWGQFGAAHGVPNLGPMSTEAWEQGLGRYKTLSGQDYTVPGGLESKDPFTYYDLLHMKAQGLNPRDLDPGVHQQIHDRMVGATTPQSPSEVRAFNGLTMGMLSPNQPLTPNELAQARVMAKGPEDINRIAGMIPWDYRDQSAAKEIVGYKTMVNSKGETVEKPITLRERLNAEMGTEFGLQAGGAGGLGARGTADLTRIAELAQMYEDVPQFFQFKGAAEGGETSADQWANYVQRISNQVPGLSAKTGSFGGVWQDPSTAAISAIDRHMARKFTTEMFPTKNEADAFKEMEIAKFNKANPGKRVSEYMDIPAGVRDDAMFAYLNAHPEMVYRSGKTGEINPEVPESLRNVDWISEPKKVATISEPYKRTLAANQAAAEEAGQGIFGSQWMLWDRIRGRLEPHEIMFPGLEKLPRMSMPQMRQVRDELSKAGYMASGKELPPVRPMNASKGAYFGLGGAALGLPALMEMYEDERRRR